MWFFMKILLSLSVLLLLLKVMVLSQNQTSEDVTVLDCISGTVVEEVLAENQSAIITSPNYPNKYPKNKRCDWKIKTTPPLTVNVYCGAINMSSRGSRCQTFLKIKRQKFCKGAPSVDNLGHDVAVRFQSRRKRPDTGFICNFLAVAPPEVDDNSPKCQKTPQLLKLELGETLHLATPRYPRSYPKNKICAWNIQGEQPGIQLTLECSEFQLQRANRRRICPDFLKVNEDEFCGVNGPPPKDYLDELNLTFKSNGKKSTKGFNCSITNNGEPSITTTVPPSPTTNSTSPSTDTTTMINATTPTPPSPTTNGTSPTTDTTTMINATTPTPPSPTTNGTSPTTDTTTMINATTPAPTSPSSSSSTSSSTTTSPTTSISPILTSTSTTTTTTTTTPATPMNECGVKFQNMKIVGGEATSRNEYPWQVALVPKRNPRFVFCGGSIIGNRWILTAAHCTDGLSIDSANVLIGAHNLLDEPLETVSINRIINHSDYSEVTLDNDISLLEVSNIDFSNTVNRVCLPNPSANFDDVDAIVTGWGTTSEGGSGSDVLLEVMVPTMSNEVCNSLLGSVTSNMICAGLTEGGKDSCQGDSGGPMVTETDYSTYTQIGIVSWGYGCAKPELPGVYTRVTEYIDWISEVTDGEV